MKFYKEICTRIGSTTSTSCAKFVFFFTFFFFRGDFENLASANYPLKRWPLCTPDHNADHCLFRLRSAVEVDNDGGDDGGEVSGRGCNEGDGSGGDGATRVMVRMAVMMLVRLEIAMSFDGVRGDGKSQDTVMGMTMVKTRDVRDCENGSSQDKSEANDDW